MNSLWKMFEDKQEMRVLVRRAKLSTDVFCMSRVAILLKHQQHLKMTVVTSETLCTKRGLVVHFPPHAFALSHSHNVRCPENNFLVISALLWVVINFSSFHNGLRLWAKKFNLLSKSYQFISPEICLFIFWLLCFFFDHLIWEYL